MPRYIFTLCNKDGKILATYIGDQVLPQDVIDHEYSTRQMREILSDYGYTLQRRA